MIIDCTVDSMSAVMAFARAGEVDWTAPDCFGCFLYAFADPAIIFAEWQTQSLKRDLRRDTLPGVVHAEVESRYVSEFRDADMSREPV